MENKCVGQTYEDFVKQCFEKVYIIVIHNKYNYTGLVECGLLM